MLLGGGGGKVSVRSIRWMSEFFILLIKTSQIHSSSPADLLHLSAISASAAQNCSNDSLSLCFLFKSLCLSKVTFVFLTNAKDKFSQKSLEEIWRTLTLVNCCPNFLIPSFPRAK